MEFDLEFVGKLILTLLVAAAITFVVLSDRG